MKYTKHAFAALTFVVLASSCKKKDDDTTTPVTTTDEKKAILLDLSANVIVATYTQMDQKANDLYTAIQTFSANPTDQNLTTAKQAWRDCRSAWESSEGFAFGPVSTNDIDPRVDTWPVNYTSLDSVLQSSNVFTSTYVGTLEDALRGFHPIEYLLFGTNGSKTAAQVTTRETEFMLALSENVRDLADNLVSSWNSGYTTSFNTAGSGSTQYPTQRSAYEELVNAMTDICDEVANSKIEEPYVQQNPALEESPFSFNSITDFTNNIRSVQNIYLGKFNTDGKGLEDFVRTYNLSLDATIKLKMNNAIAALSNITVPFGQAITQQQVQVTNAQTAVNELRDVLENQLKPFLQQYTN